MAKKKTGAKAKTKAKPKKAAAAKAKATKKKPTARKTAVAKKPKPAKRKPAPRKPAAKKPATTAPASVPADVAAALKPLFLVAPGEGFTHWSLCLSDASSPIDLFEEEGHSGNGYAWDSVARIAIADRGLDASAIEFNSEGGTFVAVSQLEALVPLGHALVALLQSGDALRDAIRRVPQDDWDD